VASNRHVILCGGAAETHLPNWPQHRLRAWGPHPNIHFAYEDVCRAMGSDIPLPFLDLLDLAVYVYVADRAISRGDTTYRHFGKAWRRELCFRMPVREPDRWNDPVTKGLLVSALGFLSEDEYDFRFEPLRDPRPAQGYIRFGESVWGGEVNDVQLYSGGVDSTAGVVQQAVVDRRRVVLVQHQPSTKPARRQRALYKTLLRHAQAAPPVLLRVPINKPKGLTRESTQRTRSFLYAALGAAMAASLGLPRVLFYENGVVSLNLPPSAQVVGARASRTTHPQTLCRLTKLFTQLAGRAFRVENPFAWETKAGLVRLLANAGCGDLIGRTTSCAWPRHIRTEEPHCGRCSQCIDRRFAVLAARQTDNDPAAGYQVDLITGERAGGHPRTMLAVYVEMASQIVRMNSTAFFGRYGESARVLRHVDGMDAQQAAHRLFTMYRDHASDVMGVVQDAIAHHAREIAFRSLPPSCLVRLVSDSGGSCDISTTTAVGENPGPNNFFRRREKAWEYRFAGTAPKILLPSVGAAYLQQLLSRPGIPIAAVELVYAVARNPRIFGLSDAGDACEKDALAAYRIVFEETTEELEEAREKNDLGAIAAHQKTLSWLSEHLRVDQGLGGRTRKASDDRERVRKAVGNALRRVVDWIDKDCSEFAAHLRENLCCGTDCCYQPEEAITWETG
jgi:7-cyano-7-deazaguanine synthase in queuosine biosynthesis